MVINKKTTGSRNRGDDAAQVRKNGEERETARRKRQEGRDGDIEEKTPLNTLMLT